MTKFITATLVALAVSASVFGATFHVPPNATIAGAPDGTVSWSGVTLASIVHYRDTNAAPVEHRVNGSSGSIKLQDVAGYGSRLQVRDPNGNYGWFTPAGVRFTLVGMHLDCSNLDGCVLEIDGTGPKSAPVPHYQGGVYAGQAPTLQVTSTSQSVGVNTTQMAVAPVGGAVVTPVAMVPPPAVVGASQSANYQRIGSRLVPVKTEAEKAGMKKPVAKAKVKAPAAVAKATPAKDCGGPPKSIDGQLVQKPCEPIYLGVPTPQVIAPAATAPATPPAATAPTAPATAAKKQG